MKILKKIFRRLTFREVIQREISQAEMERLTAETVRDHADSVVMYNTSRLYRLRERLTEHVPA